MLHDQPKNVYLGDSTVIHALGEGKVRLPTVNETYDFVLDLHKVLFVPKLTNNLLLVPAMALMGAGIRFDKDKCLILKDSKEFIIGCLLHTVTNCTQSIPLSMLKSQHLRVQHRLQFGTVHWVTLTTII